jgi:hypothetical protein
MAGADVSVYSAHPGFLVAEPFGLEYVGDLVFVHPGLVSVPEAVGR